jgi:hypothetical protein
LTEIKIPEGELAAVLGHAIVEKLSAESRETIITAALQFLMTKPAGDRYSYDRRTPLQVAFDEAVRRIANETVEQLVRESEHYQKIVGAIGTMLAGLPDPYVDNEFRNKMVSTIIEYGIDKKREYGIE